MANRILARATNRLAEYYGLYTLRDLARDLSGRDRLNQMQGGTTAQSSNQGNPTPVLPEIAKMIELIIDTSEGSVTTKNLIARLNEFLTNPPAGSSTSSNPGEAGNPTQRLNSNIKIFYGRGNSTENNLRGANAEQPSIDQMLGRTTQEISAQSLTPAQPSKTTPGLSIIQINHAMVTPSTKNTNAVVIFLNGIPTIELTRAIPIIDIQFQFAREPVDSNKRAQTLSLIRFLQGAVQADDNTTNRTMLNAFTVSASIGGRELRAATAGMELFTSPQTLVNANETENRDLRVTPVLDKFRPLMTLKGLTIEVQPSSGLMSFKTGKLDFILHDKSRLSEIADFISPNLYGATELLIEYGWSHPEGPERGNFYADVINGMRVKEKYGIINSSFAFDENGQVQITLNLAMRGVTDFQTETIGESGNLQNILRQIEEVGRTIGELNRRRNQNRVQGVREIRGVQILDAAEDARSNVILSGDMRRALREFVNEVRNSRTNNPVLSNLRNEIQRLYGNGGRPNGQSLLEQLRQNIRRTINQKVATLVSTPDPFLVQRNNRAGQQTSPGRRRDGRANNNANRDRFSLAKLLLLFIGEPLTRTGKFDDVQLVFYPFNSAAGAAKDLNISQFSVDKNYFATQYEQYRLNHVARDGNMPLREFLQFIASTIIDDLAAESYGMQTIFRHNRPNREGQQEPGATSQIRGDSVQTQTAIERRMRALNIPDGTFRMPQIDFYIECAPEDPRNAGEQATLENSNSKSILRIHIFDKQNTAYETEGSLLALMRDESLNTISNQIQSNPDVEGNEAVTNSHRQLRQQALQRATNLEGGSLIERVQENQPTSPTLQSTSGENESLTLPQGVYRIVGGPKQIKEFVMKTVPYIIHGAAGTAVKNAALSSMQDPALTTVNLQRSFRASTIDANGERPGGLPIRIIPCDLGMTTFGCPLIDYAQQFFVDFNTGTTVDNIYAVNGLTHQLGPGKFDTEMRLVPLDAYGRYESFVDRLGVADARLGDIQRSQQSSPQQGSGRTSSRR